MYSRVFSGAVYGVREFIIAIETDISPGLPTFSMVGFVGSEIKEASDRVRVALRARGTTLPPSRVTVNFSPANIPKRGVVLDLPIAIGILCCLGEIEEKSLRDVVIAGELGLDGEVRPVKGVLPLVKKAKEEGFTTCILPKENVREGAVIRGIKVVGAGTLSDVVTYLQMEEGRDEFLPPACCDVEELFRKGQGEGRADFQNVHGQKRARRVMEIAAAGYHNTLLIGAPGAGKSMLASCLPSILPPLTIDEAMEVSSIYSISGLLDEQRPFITERQLLSPHHTITPSALTGGGVIPKPGLISFAHRGVLFMDEFPEFGAHILNLLRQPMEEHSIRITRLGATFVYPARFQLIAAMNPCPCGFFPDLNRCSCTQVQIAKYLKRISGPVLDRIDLCIEVPKIEYEQLQNAPKEEGSGAIRERVMRAVKRQEDRFAGTSYVFNADMDVQAVEKYCELGVRETRLARQIFETLDLSARGYHRLLKTARTIADLAEEDRILEEHLAEAAAYRMGEGILRSGKEGEL
ncbi:MAG: YifB family Mg chelatase-like AAA ATPase [Lachnospiraceae bacterium]|nr:YifB family Mg chelatase-like AAA ATPase [Lachnospiraceae bacterium]